MHFEIKNLIENQDITIRLLSYNANSVDDLDLNILSKPEQERLINFGSFKRQCEFYFTRLLWRDFAFDTTINYLSSGKPLVNCGHLSISHAKNTVVIAFSTRFNIGLDIEFYSDKIARVIHKFLSPQEQQQFDLTNIQVLTTLWSIKEALYKLVDQPGLSLKENIRITAVGEVNTAIVHYNNQTEEFLFQRERYEDFILTYCLNEPYTN